MNKCLLVACDLHNTLLQSSSAWEKAFTEISGENKRQIADALMSKCSRHQLAKRLGISYEEVYKRYGELVEINQKVVSIICALQDHYSVVLISSADQIRVKQDIQALHDSIRFDQIYTKESFRKDCLADWEKLRIEYGADIILFFGNDPSEDITQIDYVQTVLV